MSIITRIQSQSAPLIMGIVNLTPDSFSDGGALQDMDAIKRRIEQMQQHGADILDLGGESTRPGSVPVSLDEELERILPGVELVKRYASCYVSVDTYKPQVMQASLALGVDMINDVNALEAEGAVELLARYPQACVCLMHKQGEPASMQSNPCYQDVVAEVADYLQARIERCQQAGITQQRIVVDPGFGFGKRLKHNVTLMQQLSHLKTLGCEILVGVSRKGMIGELLGGVPIEQRALGSTAAALVAVQQGASIVRVHDVAQTKQVLDVGLALTPKETFARVTDPHKKG